MCSLTTKGQSNLAKAASNVLHTLHALDSITIVVPKICRGSQKLKVGHVTQTRTSICCIVFVRAPTPLYASQTLLSVSSFCSGDMRRGSQNLKLGPLPLSVGGSGPAPKTMFYGPPGVFIPNSILICSVIFAQRS